MEKQLFANPALCTGCNRCAYACSAEKTGAFAPVLSRVKINNFPLHGFSVPSVCFQCPKADCLEACPVDAIYRDGGGRVLVKEDLCTGCGACVDKCTYGMIEMDARTIAFKCDHCGGDPACVKACYPKALTYQEPSPELIKLKGAQMKNRSKTGSAREKRQHLAHNLLSTARPGSI